MTFPLAHDEEGMPVTVPPMAVGWLVRRHSGGKGRPAAIYDREGRPLVVELDATADELLGLGCKPGSYRLDAVDQGRKPIGVTAYTEIGVALDDGEDAGGGDAVAALARAVEAMQRVQAERERVQSLMFEKLIDRIAPAPPRPGDDLRNAVTQVLDLQKAIRKAMEEETAEDDVDEDDDEQTGTDDLSAALVPLIQQLSPMLSMWLASKVTPKATTAPGPSETQRTNAVDPPSEEARQAVKEVLRHLSPPERDKAVAMVEQLSAEAGQELVERIVRLPRAEAVRELRQVLAGWPDQPPGTDTARSEPTTPIKEVAGATEAVNAVLAALTPEELRKANAIAEALPTEVRAEVFGKVAALPTPEAVKELRRLLAALPDPPPPGSNWEKKP